jgi:nitroimidazol reductase NimA-like FMN-containing flavoprotein (pyridoxamine 5'-phosphate oxidase superfamily)
MRRKDREIADVKDKIGIINQCKVCRLALSKDDRAYIVPLNYGYSFENNILTLFFHSAKDGRKIDIMKNNNNACFEIDCETELIEAEKPCKYGYAFKSIIGFGGIAFLENAAEKSDALNKIMKHQTGKEIEYKFTEDELQNVTVYKMEIKEFSGKQRVLKKIL